MESTQSKSSAATPMLTKINVGLGIVFLVLVVANATTRSIKFMQAALDVPSAISAWAYFFTTPVLALVARFLYPNARHAVTYGTLIVWAVMFLLLAVTALA